MNQRTNQPTNQLTKQPTNQPTNQPNNEPTNEGINQPTSQTTNQPTNEPTNQPTNQPKSYLRAESCACAKCRPLADYTIPAYQWHCWSQETVLQTVTGGMLALTVWRPWRVQTRGYCHRRKNVNNFMSYLVFGQGPGQEHWPIRVRGGGDRMIPMFVAWSCFW
jgi:hypothetical protein